MSKVPKWVTEQGLCACCWEKKRVEGSPRCEECKNSQLKGKRLKRCATLQERDELGLCRRCDEPAVEGKKHCQKHLDALAEKQKRRKVNGKCKRCEKPVADGKAACKECQEKINAENVEYKLQLKMDAFNAYGGPECACCHDKRIEALNIDHVDGGGNKHRAEVSGGNGGHPSYSWLKQNDYPPGFQVLCFSCNNVKYQVDAKTLTDIPQHTAVVQSSVDVPYGPPPELAIPEVMAMYEEPKCSCSCPSCNCNKEE